MKIWISFDMEGVAGIVNWHQCVRGGGDYEIGRRLLLGEVNAAIAGAFAGGATEVIVNDAHDTATNLDPAELAHDVEYLSGRYKPDYMTEGLDGSFDLAFFVGYHGARSGPAAVLSHSYHFESFTGVRLDGEYVGESGVNALVASHYGVPIGLVTGDDVTIEQARRFAPDAENVVVKQAITRYGAKHLHPNVARARIEEAARSAVERSAVSPFGLPGIARHAVLEVETVTTDHAELASWVKGVERAGDRLIRIEGEDHLRVFQSFIHAQFIATGGIADEDYR